MNIIRFLGFIYNVFMERIYLPTHSGVYFYFYFDFLVYTKEERLDIV